MIYIRLDYINSHFPLLELKVANVSCRVSDQVRWSARVSKDSMAGFRAPDSKHTARILPAHSMTRLSLADQESGPSSGLEITIS